MQSIRIIGPGRAGTSLAAALSALGWDVVGFLGRHDDLTDAASGVDVLVIATPDDVVARVAAVGGPAGRGPRCCTSRDPSGWRRWRHIPRRAALHPLVPLPNAVVGATRLGLRRDLRRERRAGGPPIALSLGGRVVEVADADRPPTTPPPASRRTTSWPCWARSSGLPLPAGLDLEAFLPLTRAAVDDVAALGPREALTGPAMRGDWDTLSRHLDALPARERAGYQAGAALATQLATTQLAESAVSTSSAAVAPVVPAAV